MATPILVSAFVSGEIAPSLYGRVDLDKERVAATTMRNMYVAYRGGASSRAGTKFVGFSKQTGRTVAPRIITFQFSINQGLMLEFGNFYMRVVKDGGFVTELPVAIGGITQANPAVLTFGAQGATAAAPNDGAVTVSYAPGDQITLTGGVALSPAVLSVTTSQLISIVANARGTGYTIADTITLAGGVSSISAIVTVLSVIAVAASGFITFGVNPSDGDTVTLNGVVWTFKTTVGGAAQTQIQSTLAGTLAQLAIDVGASANVLLTVATYSSNATQFLVNFTATGAAGNAYTLAASVAVRSGATLTGGTTTGLGTVDVTTPGSFTAIPPTGAMTQSATSGGGTGASLQTAVFGPLAVAIASPGAYTAVPADPVAQASTTGSGVGVTFNMTWAAVPAFANDDWVAISGIGGMTQLNGNTYRVAAATATTIELLDVYGNLVDSSAFGAYTGGGIAERIYTLATPYAEEDVQWLKFTQSADVMTLCCVNQDTGVEYLPQDLSRLDDDDWVFSDIVADETISPPASVTATITGSGTVFYQYVVTAVSPTDGSESIASAIASVKGVAIAAQQGQVNLSWKPVAGVNEYNVYKAQPSYGSDVPAGALFGYIGSAYGVALTDSNIIPQFAQVPPRHENPFARGQVIGVNMVAGGSGYTTATATITSATGSGAVLQIVIQSGAIVAVIINDAGEGYQPGDTIAFASASGHGATATLQIGAETGTYPSVPGYFQERRVLANTINNPDTYWMSQPGSFINFDDRIPTLDTDAIVGSPWAVQVNGIQFLVQTAGGLLVMTGSAAWLLVGAGTFATNVQAISPSSQDATPQPFTGCSPRVPPIKINYDVLYVTAKGSFYYDLPYQLYVLSEPVDITQYSTHLFVGFDTLEHAWCEQPYKVLWSVRNDGVMLSLTYLKAEQLAGWGRHDTNGLFCSVCSVTEPPVDALYVATQRYPGGQTAYMIERMDNRIWKSVEDSWCVDCALSLPQPTPQATLNASSPTGAGTIIGVTGLVGGSGYSAGTTAQIIDDGDAGPGDGAVPVLTIVGGVITAVSFAISGGAGYVNPALVIVDPANSGSGATATLVLDNSAVFTASAAVFSPANIGDVIRMGGGIATITAFTNTQTVVAKITQPIIALRPNSGGAVSAQMPGSWSVTTPLQTLSGLEYLAGATVTGLADGLVISPRQVSALGTVVLDQPASSVTIGLGFQAQLQSVYIDTGMPTAQGQRKKLAGITARVEASLGIKMGANQPDGSTLNPMQIAPAWTGMSVVPDLVDPPYGSKVFPLYTGDVIIPVSGGYGKNGQAALQQDYPLPMNILALVPEILEGDTPEQMVQQKSGGRQ